MDQYGFSLIREQQIQEINSLARIFRHNKTGAQLLSITNDDENKSFGLSFYTPVNDSTGIAHIMEHSVLCGSRKFPLKEPFIELARGSLYTFLNAMTFPDKTLYPIASQNLQDFYNLMDVYLDTAFFPTLAPEVLKQEGWHFELENPDDEMIYKGVVFNEMKGAYATPEEALDNLTKEALFPDTIYSEDSGGNPACIPNLTYANFLEFHKTYYHPSNCITVMYGDDPEEDRLKRLNAYFSEFDEIQPPPPVPLQGEFSEPKHVTGTYPAGQGEGAKSFLTLSWLLPEAINVDLLYGLNLLEEVLLGSSESPLRKVVLDSGLGESLTGSGLSSQFRQMHFSVGLKQIDEANASKVEKLILDTLQELSIKGIDAETVEAAFNSIEFAMRENNTGSFPRGLALMIRSLATWNYGGDPLELIAFERHLNSLRSKLSEKGYLEGLIETYFLKNTHRVTTLINPDPNLDGKRAEEEKARLKLIREQLTAAELDQIVQDTHALKLLQETPDSPEALATMPALALKDVERTARQIPIEKSKLSGVDLYTHDLFTNGIVYFDIGMDLHVLSSEQLPYISLFGRLLSEAGTEKTDALRFMQRVGKSTGGIHASKTTTPKRNSPQSAAMLFLRGKATPGNTGEMLALMQETLLTVRLDDKERFLQYVQEEKASIESRLAPGGAGYVKSRLMANFSESDWASESTSGLEYLFYLRRLAVEIEADWKGVLATLQQMRSLLVNRAVMVANLTLDAATQSEVLPIVGEFLEAFPGSQSELKTWPSSINTINQGYTIAGQVNHVGTAFNVYDVGYKEHGSIIPITNVLNTLWLWERVRQMGGAYGAGGGLDRMSGTFAFTSYRDPNLTKTLGNFKASSEFLRTVEISPRDLERTLVGSAGKLDPYMLPDAKGFTSMMRVLTGVTDADRQQFRNEVFETTMEHLRAFADVLDAGQENAIRAALGPEVNINAANAEQPGLLELVRVL